MFWVVRSSGIYPVRKSGIGQPLEEKIGYLVIRLKAHGIMKRLRTDYLRYLFKSFRVGVMSPINFILF